MTGGAAAALLPRTLAGRVLLVMVSGVVVAHLASFAFFEIERSRSLERFEAAEVAARITDYLRDPAPAVLRAGPPRNRLRLRWQEIDSPGLAPVGSAPAPAVFERELRRLLAESLGADPVAWVARRDVVRPDDGEPGWHDGERGPARGALPVRDRGGASVITVALRLGGERTALAETPVYQPPTRLPAEAYGSIALVFIVTTLFSIYAGRLAVRPVRMLADAAERLSRNIAEPPLPERGAAEIRAAASAFNLMQDRLRRHVNGRAAAFAAMSHDIRTPLTRMRLRLESLGGEARAKLEGDLDVIESIARSALDVTRGLALEEPLATVDIESMLRRLAEDFASAQAPIELQGHAQAIAVRPVALRRALANLVENAVKYGSAVTIAIFDAPDALLVEVLDRGPGIAAEHLDKVTIPFYRVEWSRSRDTGGAGLGLAIAKDIIESHGGELTLANRAGGGLAASVRLPR